MNKIFITGTDTDIGKTFISAILLLGLNASYWKPVQSGSKDGTDTQWLKDTTQLPDINFFKESYSFKEPLSPHLAASIENCTIDLNSIKCPDFKNSNLIVEGAGGLLVPLNSKYLIIDLIKQLNMPTIIVTYNRLGCINHTLMSLAICKQYQIDVLGVVLNGGINNDNKNAIEYYGKIPVLAQIEKISSINRNMLIELYNNNLKQSLSEILIKSK